VMLAAGTVAEKSALLAGDVKVKSSSFADSVSENAVVVKNKSVEVAENVKEKSVEVAGTVKKGAVAIAETMQGFLAPKTVKREGLLSKQVGTTWNLYYFELKEGTVYVLPAKGSEKAEFSITLDCINRAEPLDSLVTGKPNCFRVSLILKEKVAAVNNWSFFGVNFFSSNRVNNQEVDIVLEANDEDDMKGWVRELSSAANGVAFQDHLKKTGQGALKFAEATGVYTFVGTFAGLVGYRAGRKAADKVISP